MPENSSDPDAVNATSPKTVRDNGDMFPLDLEFIDDADVVTLPDGSTVLITDAPKLTSTTIRPISSQATRETSKLELEIESSKLGNTSTTNATTGNSTEEAIKLLKKRQVMVHPYSSFIGTNFYSSPVLAL